MNQGVLIVVNSLGVGGGAERIAATLGSQLNQKGYDVTFLARYHAQQLYQFEGKYKYLYETRNKNFIKKTLRELKTPKEIAKICQKKNIDSVVSFSNPPNFCAILSKIFFNNEAKVLVSVRNNPLRNYGEINKILIKNLYPKADKVIAQTIGIEEILNKKFSIKNTAVIPNLVDLQKYQNLGEKKIAKNNQNIFDDNFIFITVGSLSHQKGQEKLLRCFERVQDREENCRLIILGDGPLKNYLKNLAKRMNIDRKVLFLGKVENVFPYLRKSDCFVFTSFYEGFPNVLLEALSQNLPIISTDCLTGPREILCPNLKNETNLSYPYYGEYGILTDSFEEKLEFRTLEEKPLSKSEKVFSEAMLNLMEDKSLREKYSDQLERVKDFKIDKIIKKWEEIL